MNNGVEVSNNVFFQRQELLFGLPFPSHPPSLRPSQLQQQHYMVQYQQLFRTLWFQKLHS